MGGSFSHEFTVSDPLERTWPLVLDVERLASCLPGASVEPSVQNGLYYGVLRVKVAAVGLRYSGTVRLLDVDEDARTATLEARGGEAGGPGTAAALIRIELAAGGAGTAARVHIELRATGRAALLGRGALEEAAGATLARFAERFERLSADARPSQPAAAQAPISGAEIGAAAAAPVPASLVRRLRLSRLVPAAAVVVAGALWAGSKVRR